jgi:membrane-associated phospholipid phosphatase
MTKMEFQVERQKGTFAIVCSHLWFKCLGVTGFTSVFFCAYIYLLKNPAHAITVMPVTAVDVIIGFNPVALIAYLTLWVYVSLPPLLMQSRLEIVEYGLWIGAVCVIALMIFYFYPTAVPPANIDWARYPGMAFLKGVDAAGNACPSLHVATAVFSGFWLHWLMPRAGLGRVSRWVNTLWCLAIVYSTLATKQHVAVDVLAGAALGIALALFSRYGVLHKTVSAIATAPVFRTP